MTKQLLINATLFIVSIGWLIPLAFALLSFDAWVWKDVFPIIYKAQPEMHSFPYYQTSESLIEFTFAWFCMVVVGWAAYFAFWRPLAENRARNRS